MSSTSPDPLSSAYWPSGWSRDRLVNASSSSILSLPESEKDRMFDSLRSTLGPDGFKALLREMSDNYKARLPAEESVDEQQTSLPPHLRAPFLAALQSLYPHAEDTSSGSSGVKRPWGFVIYQLAGYGDEEGQWASFRERWDEIIREQLRHYDGVPGVADAVESLEFRWIEDRDQFEGAALEFVASHYRNILTQQPPLPSGLAHPLCLAITPSSLSSVLTSALPSSAPRLDRNKIPFAVAIDKWLGEVLPSDQDVEAETELEGSEAPQTFNVAVESLLDEFFTVVGGDIMPVRELAVGMGPKQVWVSSAGRYGVHEIVD